jgi:RND family efflux transporter MFP subunit
MFRLGSWQFAAITLVGLIGFISAGCHKGAGNSDNTLGTSPTASSSPLSVRTMTVGLADTPRWTEATGTVSAQFTADISTRTTARVTEVLVSEGDSVRRGQTLVVLDAQDVDASIAQAAADVSASNVSYQSALANERMAQTTTAAQVVSARAAVAQAEAALATAISRRNLVNAGPRPQERAESVENSARANAALVLAQKTYDRMARLYKEDAVTGQQLDGAKSDLDAAEASYDAAMQAQNMTTEGSRSEDKETAEAQVREAQAAVQQARAGLAQAQAAAMQVEVRRADTRQAQAQIGKARAGLGAAVANRIYSTIAAPFNGIVTERLADPGTMAGPGVPLLRVQGGDLRLDAVVPESTLPFVHAGNRISVVLDALGTQPVPATVVTVSPRGDPTSHTFLVKARLPLGVGAKSGMYGRARIRTGSDRSMTVPENAVVNREGLYYVFVVRSGIARLRLVSVGGSDNDRVTILSGIRSGERIAVTGVDKLTDNAPVSEDQ